jgi:hypothetical protein
MSVGIRRWISNGSVHSRSSILGVRRIDGSNCVVWPHGAAATNPISGLLNSWQSPKVNINRWQAFSFQFAYGLMSP